MDYTKAFKEAYELCREKFNIHMEKLDGSELYEFKGSTDGRYYDGERGFEFSFMYNWMTSFTTGLAPIFYDGTKDEKYLIWANKFEKYYHSKAFETPMETMHDLGFLYVPYSVAMYRLTGSKSHREDAIKAADELCKRFELRGKYIDAWRKMDETKETGRGIIDCMMNLALLTWAWKETGHTFYRDIAVLHAETTIKYFIREDMSVAHSFDFDRRNGEMLQENNSCGYSNGSYWARGTTWAIYGFALLGGYTGDEKYIKLSEEIAQSYIKQIPEETTVPVWDFRLPKDMPAKACGNKAQWDESKSENCIYNVDTSAAAIAASGMMELYRLTGDDKWKEYAQKSIYELCEKYLNTDKNIEGIMSHQNGQMSYTSYGDYYFVEALHKLIYGRGFWS